MDDDRYLALQRQCMIEPRKAREALIKLAAMDELARAGMPIPQDKFRADCLWLLQNPFSSWEGSRVLSRARRLLDYLDGDPDLIFESTTPDQLAGPDYWPGPSDPFADLDLGNDTQGRRDHWRTQVEGDPPWKRDQEGQPS